MSWEYIKYEAKCTECGQKGICIKGMDDWNRCSTSWEGFENKEADSNAVARKRTDIRDLRAICHCGSSKIEVGHVIE